MNMCPKCQCEEYDIVDDQGTSYDGWYMEFCVCNECGQEFELHYKLVFDNVVEVD